MNPYEPPQEEGRPRRKVRWGYILAMILLFMTIGSVFTTVLSFVGFALWAFTWSNSLEGMGSFVARGAVMGALAGIGPGISFIYHSSGQPSST